MATSSNINLLKTSGVQGQLGEWDAKLRVISLWSIGILLGVGIVMGGLYLVISTKTQNLSNDKVNLLVQIQQQSTKEGILLTLKQRIAIADKAMKANFVWGKLFSLLSGIAPVSNFSTIAVDETGRVTIVLTVSNVDDAVTIAQRMMAAGQDNKLRSGQLTSFSLSEDGTIRIGFSFIPNLL